MVFQSFSRFFGEFFDRGRKGRRHRPSGVKLRKPLMEVLEDRLSPATLSAPIVQNARPFLDYQPNLSTIDPQFDPQAADTNSRSNPQLAVDPLNPNNLVVVTKTTAFSSNFNPSTEAWLAVSSSADGGVSWRTFAIGNGIIDPDSPAAPNSFPYQVVSDPSVTFDRLGNIYIAAHQHNPNMQSGAIVLHKYDFDDIRPALIEGFAFPLIDGEDNPIHRWYRGPNAAISNVHDSAYHPVVGIDNNIPYYVDPQTGLVQTDSLATLVPHPTRPAEQVPKAVFVAWSSREVSSSTVLPLDGFPYNGPIGLIKIAVSGDGGETFSTRENVSDFSQSQFGGFLGSNDVYFNSGRPQFFFTQGTPYDPNDPNASPRVEGGLLGVAWDNFGSQGQGSLSYDLSAPDHGNANQAAAVNYVFPSAGPTGGAILDACCTPNQPNVTSNQNSVKTTIFENVVNITDPNFDYLTNLEVTLNIIHPHLNQLHIQLVAPDGTTITLLRNRTNSDGTSNFVVVGGNTIFNGVADSANMGVVNDRPIGTIFTQNAARRINVQDGSFRPVAPFIGYFQPEVGSLDVFNGLTAAQLNGTWRLRISDFRSDGNNPGPDQEVVNWSIKMTARVADNGQGNAPSNFGADQSIVTGGAVTAGFTSPYPTAGGIYGTQGISAGLVIAVDNTLGSFSPYQGRIYAAYTSVGGDIQLRTLDNASANGFSSFQSTTFGSVNDDSASDYFSQGDRIQYMPSIAVDQVTGTLVVSWYDARNDAGRVRMANYITTSIDGGQTFSEQVPINISALARDALTGELINIGPIGGQNGLAGTYGFGSRQALYAYNGRVIPFYSSNLNTSGVSVYTADIYIGAGPRIVIGDQGPVVNAFTAGTGLFYNNTFASDGKRQLDGFLVTFDRPIDPATFSPGDVALMYQNPNSPASGLIDRSNQILSVTPLDVDAVHGIDDAGVAGRTRPTLVLNDSVVTEGNTGQKLVTMTVTMSLVQTTPITFSYATADGSAQSGSDYLPTAGTLTIPAGQTSASFTIAILGDLAQEGNEFLWVGLFNLPTTIDAAKPIGRVIILDDENSPTLIVGDGIAKEGDVGLTTMTFPIVLSGPAPSDITLTYATSDGTAAAGLDYTSIESTIIIPAGATSTSIDIQILGDQIREGNENFFLNFVGSLARSEQQTITLSNSGNLNATVTLGFLGEVADEPLFVGTLPTAAQLQAHLETISSLAGNISVTSSVPGTYIVTFRNAGGTGDLTGLDVPNVFLVASASQGDATIVETAKGGSTDTIAITRSAAVGLIVDDDDLAVSVDDVSVREGTDANAIVSFHLNGITSRDVTVNFSLNTTGIVGPTATNGSDYTFGGPFSITIPAGSASASISIPIVNNTTVEPTERFNVTITSTTNAATLKGTGVVTIVDDDTPAAAIFMGDIVVREGDMAPGTPPTNQITQVQVPIRLTEPVSANVTGFFSTSNGTATGSINPGANVDFRQLTNVPFTILAGQTQTFVTVEIFGDLNVENDETFNMTLSGISGGVNSIDTSAARARTSAIATIVDDDVNIYLADAFSIEPNGDGLSNNGSMTFTVHLNSPKNVPITFLVSAVDGTATSVGATPPAAGEIDFDPTFVDRLVTIPAGSTSQTFTIGIRGDDVAELTTFNANEHFTMVINPASITVGGATTTAAAATSMLTRGTAIGTIVDNDSAGFITVSNPTVREDTPGFMSFTVYLSQPSATDTLMYYYTQNLSGGNAAIANVAPQAGDDYVAVRQDYAPPPENLITIIAESQTRTIFVPINADLILEGNEQFILVLCDPNTGEFTQNVLISNNPSLGGGIGSRGIGVGTIVNDDRPHAVFANAVALEGESVVFPGVTSYPAFGDSVDAEFISGTAIANEDFSPTTDFDFSNSQGQFTNLATFAVNDSFSEGNQSFTAALTSTDIRTTQATVSATIIDADRLGIVAGDFTIRELDGGTVVAQIPVYLTGTPNTGRTVTVNYSFVDGVAVNGVDYDGVAGTLTFDPADADPLNRVRQYIQVPIHSDNAALGNKSFQVNFSSPTNAGLLQRTELQTLTVTDSNTVIFRDASGNTAVAQSVFFNLTAANIQTAIASLIPGVTVSLVSSVGTTQTFLINYNNSADVPDIEIFRAYQTGVGFPPTITEGSATVVETQKGGIFPTTITILDASQRPNLTIGSTLALEGDAGTTPANFTILSSYPIANAITAQISTANGTALAVAGDYTPLVNQSVTILPGATSTTVAVQVNGDTLSEGEETFTASIVSATNATIRGDTGTGIIVDDDNAPNISLIDVSVQEGNYTENNPTLKRYAEIVVHMNKAVNYPVSFTLTTADGTATGGLDFVHASTTVTIPAGATSSAPFRVEILPDTLKEGDETFFVNVTDVVGASVYKGQSKIFIQDDDGLYGATQFLVRMTPQSDVGSYAYSVGAGIGDRIRTALPTVDALNTTMTVYNPNIANQNLVIGIGGGNPTLSQLTIAGVNPQQVIRDITVTVNINHPDPTNFLVVELISPSGQVVQLFNRTEFPLFTTDDGANLTNTTFDARSLNRLGFASAPFVGDVQPVFNNHSRILTTALDGLTTTLAVPFDALHGLSPNGTWVLRVRDTSGAVNSGTLRNWSLNVLTGAPLANGQLGNAMDQDQSGFTNDRLRGGDAFSMPDPVNGRPFQLPYVATTSPLVIPGPYAFEGKRTYVSQDSVRIPAQFFGGNGTNDDLAYSTIEIDDIPAGQRLSDLNVTVKFDHLRPRDLSFNLISPDGTRIRLSVEGETRTRFVSSPFTFDDQTSRNSPLTIGLPYDALSIFNGEDPNGVWTLEILDSNFPTFGTLLQWSLEITTERVAVNESISFLEVAFDRDINVATFTPQNLRSVMGPLGPITGPFTVTPINPVPGMVTIGGVSSPGTVARSFRVGFPEQTFSGSYAIVFGIDPTRVNAQGQPDPNRNYIADARGNKIDSNFNAGVSVMRGADPTNASIATVTSGSGNLTNTTNIVGGRTTNFTININDAYLINYLTLTLDIQITDISNLEAVLISPTGTIVPLFTQPGLFASAGNRQNMSNATLDDAGATPIQLANPPYLNGRFNPQQPLSALIGETSRGQWTLAITNRAGSAGWLRNWSLNIDRSVPGSGLGEEGSDQFQRHFRVFVQDPTNSTVTKAWQPVGATAQNQSVSAGASPIPAVAIDPADPSGNTAFVGTSSGGVWKTSNFLTNDPLGPTYVPLLDFAPIGANGGNGLNIGAISVFARNRDPNQSIIFVGTGGIGGNGIGVLRSMDGGRSWHVLDSLDNADSSGTVFPLNDLVNRDKRFVADGVTTITIDPNPGPGGKVVLYIAVRGGTNPGLYRSMNSGDNWELVRAGEATDIVLAAGSKNSTGNLTRLYAGFANEGVFTTSSATASVNLDRLDGGQGAGYRTKFDSVTGTVVPVPVNNPVSTPSTNPGPIIRLATPALTGNPLLDTVYQSYIYAVAGNALYTSKDAGANWTRVKLPIFVSGGVLVAGTNNDNYTSPGTIAGGVVDLPFINSITIDPQNPNIVYLQYAGPGTSNPTNILRVDLTTVSDPYALVQGDHTANDGGQVFNRTVGALVNELVLPPIPPGTIVPGTATSYGIYARDASGNFTGDLKSAYFNAMRDPDEPFLSATSQLLAGSDYFSNDGNNAKITNYYVSIGSTVTRPGSTVASAGLPFIPTLVAAIDPETGLTRVIIAGFEGLYTALDDGSGNRFIGEGKSIAPAVGNRTGNIAAGLFYDGAAQPSILAAQLANALFYATTLYGTYQSTEDFLSTGNITWSLNNGASRQIQTDPSGTGKAFEYVFPYNTNLVANSLQPADFFQLINAGATPIGRTTGLIQFGDNPASGAGQWPLGAAPLSYQHSLLMANLVGKFATNPIDPTALLIGSQPLGANGGKIFRSVGQVVNGQAQGPGQGLQWTQIASQSDLDGTYPGALAFGAPSTATSTTLSDFIYAGTTGGDIYVTNTGGGAGGWRNISTGLDGSAVLAIIPNPKAGARDAFAVTTLGVYYLSSSNNPAPAWVRLNDVAGKDSIFTKTRTVLGTSEVSIASSYLTDLAVDWRFAVPGAGGTTHPVLYLSTDGGVFRSIDFGNNWKLFPSIDDQDALVDGGYLPNIVVSDIDLVLGDTTPISGFVNESTGFNMLYATTFGRSAFAIRLDNSDVEQFRNVPTFGPRVVGATAYTSQPSVGIEGIEITFDTTVDPVTFTVADVISIVGPGGVSISATGVEAISNTTFRVLFDLRTAAGDYTITFGPTISDFSGNLLITDNGTGIATRTVMFVPVTPPAITGVVYRDFNLNGVREGGEHRLSRTLYLDLDNNGSFDAGEPTAISNGSTGIYSFNSVPFGSYVVRLLPDQGDGLPAEVIAGYVVTIDSIDDVIHDRDFGIGLNVPASPLAVHRNPFGPGNNSSTNEAIVRGIYRITLGREAEPAGVAYWVSQLNSGRTGADVADGIWNSFEHRAYQVRFAFNHYLGRDVDPTGLAYWVTELHNGFGEINFNAGILQSAEYRAMYPTNAEYVTALYLDIIHRVPEQSGLDYWVNRLVTGQETQASIAFSFFKSEEYQTRIVDSYFSNILARQANPSDYAYWVNALISEKEDIRTFAFTVFASAEYAARAARYVS